MQSEQGRIEQVVLPGASQKRRAKFEIRRDPVERDDAFLVRSLSLGRAGKAPGGGEGFSVLRSRAHEGLD